MDRTITNILLYDISYLPAGHAPVQIICNIPLNFEGYESTIIETPDKYKLIGDAETTINRKLQTIDYKKYNFVLNEYSTHDNIRELTNCNTFVLYFADGSQIESKTILSIDKKQADNCQLWTVTITFLEYSKDEESVNNFLTSDVVSNRYTDYATITINDTTYYTVILPFINILDLVKKDITSEGIKKLSTYIYGETINLILFVSESQKNDILRYIPIYTPIINYNTVNYTAKQYIMPEIKQVENAIDLWQVNIELLYSTTFNNPIN